MSLLILTNVVGIDVVMVTLMNPDRRRLALLSWIVSCHLCHSRTWAIRLDCSRFLLSVSVYRVGRLRI